MHNTFGFLLGKAYRDLHYIIEQYFKPYDITLDQWILLRQLDSSEPISQKILASKTCKDQSNTTRILDQLERKGLVERLPNQNDRRSFLITKTPKANAWMSELRTRKKQAMNIATADISDEDLANMKQLLRSISTNVETFTKEFSHTIPPKGDC